MASEAEIVAVAALLTNKSKCKVLFIQIFLLFDRHVCTYHGVRIRE